MGEVNIAAKEPFLKVYHQQLTLSLGILIVPCYYKGRGRSRWETELIKQTIIFLNQTNIFNNGFFN